jgi:hypothetical protein
VKTTLGKIHLATGFILLVIFPLTGAYLRYCIPHLMEQSDRFRFSMRANHVYILFSGLVHLSLGVYLSSMATKLMKRLQAFAGSLLIMASAMLVAGFFFEPKLSLDRPVTLIAAVMSLVGVTLHHFCALLAREESA